MREAQGLNYKMNCSYVLWELCEFCVMFTERVAEMALSGNISF